MFEISHLMFVVLAVVLFLLMIIGLATLVIVAKLYSMHNVRGADGRLAWMVPDNYTELVTKLNKSQEKIVEQLSQLSEHNKTTAQLMKSSVDALLEMRQELNGR